VMHEWALDPDDDRSDMGVVRVREPGAVADRGGVAPPV